METVHWYNLVLLWLSGWAVGVGSGVAILYWLTNHKGGWRSGDDIHTITSLRS